MTTLDWDHQWLEPITFSPDGRWLAGVSGGRHAGITLWDVKADDQSHNFPFPSGDLIQAATFSPNSRLLAFSATNKIRVWDVDSHSMLYEIPAHDSWVSALAFSPDGRFLVSGSWDHTIKIWDARTGNTLRTINGHTNTIRGVCGELLILGKSVIRHTQAPSVGVKGHRHRIQARPIISPSLPPL